MGVQRGDAGLGARAARGRGAAPDALHDRGDVLGGGAAAPAHQRQAELAGEPLVRVGELIGRERVARPAGGQLGQSRVRHAGQRDAGVRGQVAQVLAHLPGAGGAVEPDDVDAERLQRGERGADLAAEQHGAGRLDRDVRDEHDIGYRTVGHRRGDRAPGPDDRGLGLQQVLARLDDDRVGAAAEQAGRVELVGVPEGGEGDVPQRRQLRPRPHGTRAPSAGGPARTPRPRPRARSAPRPRTVR